jgi:hypothetical protein
MFSAEGNGILDGYFTISSFSFLYSREREREMA